MPDSDQPDRQKPQARITGSERLFTGFFKLDELTIEADAHGGGQMVLKRLILDRGHAVAILAYDPQRDEVLMVNEMRPGMLAAGQYPFSDSLPAGMIDEGEDALEAAARELQEETGALLTGARLIHDGAFVSSGGTSEKISLVVGFVDMSAVAHGSVHGKAEEGEDIRVVVMKADDFIARTESGRQHDMKTMICAFWLDKHRPRLQREYAVENGTETAAQAGSAANDSGTAEGIAARRLPAPKF
ncbi:MAG: NUDIX domain-containing protein [Alphaproteobacteria bacterium]|nr:NUDIX domain-containing protein [Alphaproteobacteria bacterium]